MNPNISDVGVLALAAALLKPTTTFLRELELRDVGMGNKGIAALASLVDQGRMEYLDLLIMSINRIVFSFFI